MYKYIAYKRVTVIANAGVQVLLGRVYAGSSRRQPHHPTTSSSYNLIILQPRHPTTSSSYRSQYRSSTTTSVHAGWSSTSAPTPSSCSTC